MAGPKGLDPQQISKLYLESQMSMQQIGSQLGCSTSAVKHHLRRQGIECRPLKKIDWPIEQMRQWYEVDGMTLQQIADKLGEKQKVVNKVAKRNGFRLRRTGPPRGELHPEWKGGRHENKNGYIQVYMPEHPTHNGKYVLEHRLVMEKHLGRYLLPTEVVHHRNGVKDDNRIENLEVFQSNAEHLAETLKGKCPNWTPEGRAKLQQVAKSKQRVDASVAARRLKRSGSSSPQNSGHSTDGSDKDRRKPSETGRQPWR